MTPPTVNAYYNAAQQRDRLPGRHPPAAVLRPPMRRRRELRRHRHGDRPRAAPTASTTRAASSTPTATSRTGGRADDRKAFDERTDCVAKQYDGFVTVKDAATGDVHLNGQLTLGENIADNGGAARRLHGAPEGARRQAADTRSTASRAEQRFFLGFANVWCQNVTEAAARQLRADRPALVRRVPRDRQPSATSPEFKEAFGCKAGQPMVRGERLPRVVSCTSDTR